MIDGYIFLNGQKASKIDVYLINHNLVAKTDTNGYFAFNNLENGIYILLIDEKRIKSYKSIHEIINGQSIRLNIRLNEDISNIDEIVISSNLKEVSKLESAAPVEIYKSEFFNANPTPSIFDALQNVNGIRPQLNCNICNTGDIHINGLEGPYTMVLIDGMPIVSGLSTVYGLSGIPQSLIDRIEVIKGPASTLYGSEAVGGLINVITKKPEKSKSFSTDIFGTSWAEINLDLSTKFKVGKKSISLIGLNYYNYNLPIDNNLDGFTDVTLQNRISIFNKWNFERKENRIFSIAARYIYENRWGGEMNWNDLFRGSDTIYGESIYTKRWETFGSYQLPFKENIIYMFSANGHDHDSYYGDLKFQAKQYILFNQLTWNKSHQKHDILIGAALRYTSYDDSTPATESTSSTGLVVNEINKSLLPGIFIQDEIKFNLRNKLILGFRYDYHQLHGNILSPRVNYKINSIDNKSILRLSIGNGYRIANVFTEDHAALTGARDVVFSEELHPETSWNGNINFEQRIYSERISSINIDASLFYTYFNNKIIPDYDTDVDKIIYSNLVGYAISRGASLNLNFNINKAFSTRIGATFIDMYSIENNIKTYQYLTEKFSSTWSVQYKINSLGLVFNYTGNLYSPMILPLLGDLDPRNSHSPWYSIQNIKVSKEFKNKLVFYGGVKNLLNWTPNKSTAFLIARANDPFDNNVQFDSNGSVVPTQQNPYALTFDPSYIYAPNQGIRFFVGMKYSF